MKDDIQASIYVQFAAAMQRGDYKLAVQISADGALKERREVLAGQYADTHGEVVRCLTEMAAKGEWASANLLLTEFQNRMQPDCVESLSLTLMEQELSKLNETYRKVPGRYRKL
jgi:hypothetical protein